MPNSYVFRNEKGKELTKINLSNYCMGWLFAEELIIQWEI